MTVTFDDRPQPSSSKCHAASGEVIVSICTASCPSSVMATVLATLLVASATCGCAVREPIADPASALSSANLATRVRAALNGASFVDDLHVNVSVEKGKVVLTGIVEDEHALTSVLGVARKAAQGHEVIDAIVIEKTSSR